MRVSVRAPCIPTLALTRAARRAFCHASLAERAVRAPRPGGAPDKARLWRARSSPRRGGALPRRFEPWVRRVGKRGCPVHELGLPLPRVKSPPWHMNCEMTRWKAEPLKWSGLPL